MAIAEHDYWHSAISDFVVRLVFDDCILAGFLVPRGHHTAQCPSEDLHLRISMPIRLEDLVGRWRDAPGHGDSTYKLSLGSQPHSITVETTRYNGYVRRTRALIKLDPRSDQWLHHLGASWHAQISSGVDVFSEP